MQQGLTGIFSDDFWEIFPLKINARTWTLKVTYHELRQIKNIPWQCMPTW
jgi:hypothetical protein